MLNWIRNSPVDYSAPDPASYLNNSWALEQTNNAAYAQLNFSSGGLRGNLGVRYVDSKTEGSGFVYSGTPSSPTPAACGRPAPARKTFCCLR